MERDIGSIKLEIALLQRHAADFRRLAAEYSAADEASAAEKMVLVAVDLEARAATLERMMPESATAAREAR